MKYPWLFVGAKVTRVKETLHWEGTPLPAIGETLTVVNVMPHPALPQEIIVGFAEYPGAPGMPAFPGTDRWMYYARDFRPLHDTSTQVESMRELMKKAAREQRVSA